VRPSNDREAITLVIEGLVSKGITLTSVEYGDGEIPVSTVAEAVEEVTSVDMATLVVGMPKGGESWVYFVLGNEPEEVVCDHGVSLGPYIDPIVRPWWE